MMDAEVVFQDGEAFKFGRVRTDESGWIRCYDDPDQVSPTVAYPPHRIREVVPDA